MSRLPPTRTSSRTRAGIAHRGDLPPLRQGCPESADATARFRGSRITWPATRAASPAQCAGSGQLPQPIYCRCTKSWRQHAAPNSREHMRRLIGHSYPPSAQGSIDALSIRQPPAKSAGRRQCADLLSRERICKIAVNTLSACKHVGEGSSSEVGGLAVRVVFWWRVSRRVVGFGALLGTRTNY
jgi:hypothetical protein